MFWADAFAESIKQRFKSKIAAGEELIIRDEKTFSGRVHVGSLRGVVIHGIMADVLNKQGIRAKFLFEVNDFDPMDDCPPLLKETHFKYMGMPLYKVPSPDGKAPNFAEYYAEEFLGVMERIGFSAEYYRLSEAYQNGKFNEVIRSALTKANIIRKIYKEISGSDKPEDWLPISIVCPKCGKILTTKATDFDGKTVAFTCQTIAVTEGCGEVGRISPFDGNAKLAWKPDWAAKWKVFGVNVEGGGKDHATKGGSRDVSRAIAEEVFHYPNPFDIPYEFFVIGGKKMSSSKGRGASAKEVSDLLPSKIARLLFLRKDPKRPIDFDPEGDTIPVLYDEYDRLAEAYFSGEKGKEDFARIFELSHSLSERGKLKKIFLPRFREIAFLSQLPHIDFHAKVAEMKGAPLNADEIAEADLRREFAEKWLRECAPEEFVFRITDSLPENMGEITESGRKVLTAILSFFESTKEPEGEQLHSFLHHLKSELNVQPQEIFVPIYQVFLGRNSGPKAGWLLSVLGSDFVIKRLQEALTQGK